MKSFIDKIMGLSKERDFMAKVISLVLAVVLWAFISSSKTERLEFKIPIETKNLPNYLMITDMSAKYVNVVIEGKKGYLKNVNVKNIKASVNLENPKLALSTKYVIDLNKQHIPEDIDVWLSKKEVDITVDRRDEKWIRIEPTITGKLQDGKFLGKIKVVPDKVKISGPSSVIGDIKSLYTEDISLENESGIVRKQVGIKKEKIKGVDFSETSITVTIPILDSENINIINLTVSVRNPNRNFNYVLKDREINLYVRTKNQQKIAPDDADAFIDASKINIMDLMSDNAKAEITSEAPVIIRWKNPDKIESASVIPDKISVRILRK